MGRIRLHLALDCSAFSLETFIIDNIEVGATIVIDSWRSYQFIDKEQYRHSRRITGGRSKGRECRPRRRHADGKRREETGKGGERGELLQS